jgi:hypothetical protein
MDPLCRVPWFRISFGAAKYGIVLEALGFFLSPMHCRCKLTFTLRQNSDQKTSVPGWPAFLYRLRTGSLGPHTVERLDLGGDRFVLAGQLLEAR